jgi:hypothetical protein
LIGPDFEESAATTVASSQIEPKPNRVDVIIALVICCALLLFVFWLATQFMDQTSFGQIPDFMKSGFSGLC